MRFDIDYARAKTMATRLQAFLDQNPKGKLSRSSAIEAIAKTLGFNNRNEMSARLSPAEDTAPAEQAPQTPSAAARTALAELRISEIFTCAQDIVAAARKIAPDLPFYDAIHQDGEEGVHALILVEDEIEDRLNTDPDYMSLLHAAFFASEELEMSLQENPSLVRGLCKALVNEALPMAEGQWMKTMPHETARHFRPATEAPDEPATGETSADQPADHPGIYDVTVSCWMPGTLQVELPGDRVGEIAAEVYHQAIVTGDSPDEAHARNTALTYATVLSYGNVWTAMEKTRYRNARWVSTAQDGDIDALIARDDDLPESHWEFDVRELEELQVDLVSKRD